MKRRSSVSTIADLPHSVLPCALEKPPLPRKSELTIEAEFEYIIIKIIESKEVFTLFSGLHLTSIDETLGMLISKLRTFSLASEEEDEPLEL